MDELKQLNLAMGYIEANITDDIDFQKAARIAGCSEYQFKRMFPFLSGINLSEYVRRRRLTLAALELHKHDGRVLDLAIKYGYDSPDSFTRAFQAFHGMTPTEARKDDAVVKAFPPMTFQLTIAGGNEMNYRIIDKDAFNIVGIKKRISLVYEGVNHQMDDMWTSLTEKDFIELKQLSNAEPGGIICASTNFSEGRSEGTMLDQYIGVASTKNVPERWEVLPVDACTWAIFTAIGDFPATLQNLWARIFSEWLPTSGYELISGPEILWNEGKDTTLPDYKSEIWIPVKQR
ncbi:MAG TPA: AraC family transcriptional regulator [Sphaerochaeta sp.]|nr:MAG: AraC family transcriptional regulator [Spirochaetes bacterium GWC2_52_13]PKL20726.1 MAG: AraC family transcriptional regulator [Spirochaetae bacterium HGW-Spirochaetae-4]HCG62301.1 AraC family transcriptional regulator [Sphaerochaeta sp.]HCJ94383.1 AraC family transcriptional regulator [Sphaerochaeta sp.]HCS37693.1 AraC family transcriptional regulator [Sphaerochaeta sp.]